MSAITSTSQLHTLKHIPLKASDIPAVSAIASSFQKARKEYLPFRAFAVGCENCRSAGIQQRKLLIVARFHRQHAGAPEVKTGFSLKPLHASDEVFFKVPSASPLPFTKPIGLIAEVPVELGLCERRRVAEISPPTTFVKKTKKRPTSHWSLEGACGSHVGAREDVQNTHTN